MAEIENWIPKPELLEKGHEGGIFQLSLKLLLLVLLL